jgi:hypothetical protein
MVVGVAALAVVALVGGVLIENHGSGSDADAAIVKAADGALAGKSAHVAVTGTIQAGATTVTATGTGSVDFTTSAMDMDMDVNESGQQIDEQVIYLGGMVYEGIPQIAQVDPGKSWLSLDLTSLEQSAGQGTSPLEGNPLAMLHALAQQGNAVVDQGATTWNGQSVERYTVTVNPAVVQGKMEKANLPDWMKQVVSQISVKGDSLVVYINGAGDLAGETVTTSETVGAKTVAVHESYDFSDYGTPVAAITAPPADQVVSFDDFLKLTEGALTS